MVQRREPPLRRLPRGRRGLKYGVTLLSGVTLMSPPAREAWIEIFWIVVLFLVFGVASREGGVD